MHWGCVDKISKTNIQCFLYSGLGASHSKTSLNVKVHQKCFFNPQSPTYPERHYVRSSTNLDLETVHLSFCCSTLAWVTRMLPEKRDRLITGGLINTADRITDLRTILYSLFSSDNGHPSLSAVARLIHHSACKLAESTLKNDKLLSEPIQWITRASAILEENWSFALDNVHAYIPSNFQQMLWGSFKCHRRCFDVMKSNNQSARIYESRPRFFLFLELLKTDPQMRLSLCMSAVIAALSCHVGHTRGDISQCNTFAIRPIILPWFRVSLFDFVPRSHTAIILDCPQSLFLKIANAHYAEGTTFDDNIVRRVCLKDDVPYLKYFSRIDKINATTSDISLYKQPCLLN